MKRSCQRWLFKAKGSVPKQEPCEGREKRIGRFSPSLSRKIFSTFLAAGGHTCKADLTEGGKDLKSQPSCRIKSSPIIIDYSSPDSEDNVLCLSKARKAVPFISDFDRREVWANGKRRVQKRRALATNWERKTSSNESLEKKCYTIVPRGGGKGFSENTSSNKPSRRTLSRSMIQRVVLRPNAKQYCQKGEGFTESAVESWTIKAESNFTVRKKNMKYRLPPNDKNKRGEPRSSRKKKNPLFNSRGMNQHKKSCSSAG